MHFAVNRRTLEWCACVAEIVVSVSGQKWFWC